MAELPSRTCGSCPLSGNYEEAAEAKGDYLNNNTVPKPDLVYTGAAPLNDKQLGVPSTYYPVDLQAPIIDKACGDNVNPQLTNAKDRDSKCCCEVGKHKITEEICKESPYSRPKIIDEALNIASPDMAYNINSEVSKNMGLKSPDITIEQAKPELKGILKKAAPCPCKAVHETHQNPMTQKVAFQEPTVFGKPKEAEKVVNRECYLPKPEDEYPQHEEEMGPLGPWATGRVDWGPLAGLTGIRPVVDKYSISRFSEGEWRSRNKEILDSLVEAQHQANVLDYNSQESIALTRTNADKNQADSTRRLYQRSQEVHRWKCELERAITAADEEISKMQEQRRRLKQSMAVLQLPEAIASECLERRTGRNDSELVRDEVEEELIKEMALTAEIREQFSRTLADIEHQLLEDKTAKNRLEYDWSDKKLANQIECVNVALNDRSNVLMFKPGAVGFPDHQSTMESWEKFTRETLEESEITRQRSVALRGTLDAVLINAANNLRAQADQVENALAKRIACIEEIEVRLQNELRTLLKRLADIETTVFNLKAMIRRMDVPLKKAQTRLDNRSVYRPRVENCRDEAQYGLVDEVKSITENVAALTSQLYQAEAVQNGLMKDRSTLEREIGIKKKTMEIDRERIRIIRSHYPTAAAMAGH